MDAITRAHAALRTAAERIGRNNFRSGLYTVRRNSRGRVTQGYSITAEHERVIQAMPAVLSGTLSPNDAMAMLHEHDIQKQRLG